MLTAITLKRWNVLDISYGRKMVIWAGHPGHARLPHAGLVQALA